MRVKIYPKSIKLSISMSLSTKTSSVSPKLILMQVIYELTLRNSKGFHSLKKGISTIL
jgi:hypothetical protein